MNGFLKTVRAAGRHYNLTLSGGSWLSQDEVAEVAQLVYAGGAVKGTIEQIERRVRDAQVFIIATLGNEIVGVAALKSPHQDYRDKLQKKTGVELSQGMYPAELGYVSVSKFCRGGRLSSVLMGELMSLPAGSAGVFATTKLDGFYKAALPELGFSYKGSYRNDDNEIVHLLTKTAAQSKTGQNHDLGPKEST